jgi:hypothetical protein
MTSRPALQIVNEAPPAATWDHARELFGRVLPTVGDWLELGAVLTVLREEFFAQTAGLRRGNSPSSHGATPGPDVPGWQAKVREELGISHHTALRYLEKSHYVALLDNARRLKPVTYLRDGEPVTVKPTAEMGRLAADALNEVLAGTKKPGCAWAGVCGEGLRVAETGKKERAAVDHAMNLSNAIAKLKTSLPHWREIDPHDRADVEAEFNGMKHLLEGTLL